MIVIESTNYVEAPLRMTMNFDCTALTLKCKWSVYGCCGIKNVFFRLQWTRQVKIMSGEGMGKEVWMEQSLQEESKHAGLFWSNKNLWCRNAFAFRVNQHLFQQWRSFQRRFRHQLINRLASHIGKCDFVVVGKGCHFLRSMRKNAQEWEVMSEWFKWKCSYRPESMRRCSQSSKHTNQLIDIILPTK